MNDKVALFFRLLLPIYQTGVELGQPNDNYRILLNQLARYFQERFQPGALPSHPSALPWDLGRVWLTTDTITYTVMDTSRGNRFPLAVIDLYQGGIVFDRFYIHGLSGSLDPSHLEPGSGVPGVHPGTSHRN